jgi:type I restriction enzyme S subunit
VSFKPYPKYKESGVEWLGRVPEHWGVCPVKSIATIVNGYPFDSKSFDPNAGYPLVRIRDLNKPTTEAFYNGDFVEAAAIDSTDVLIGMDGDFNVGRWKGEGTALLNQRMCCARGRSIYQTRFLEYTLPIPLAAINAITYSTTVKHLSSSEVEHTRVALPPEEAELEGILSFLDYETAKIDALIAEQQRLIELLQEKRQAVISHAVTKGLNPIAPMKDSGIEWLGKVPEHWEVAPLKRFVRGEKGAIKTGPFGSNLTSADMEAGEFRVYTQRSVLDDDCLNGDAMVSAAKFEELLAFEAFPGDILVTTRGTIGRVAIVPQGAGRGILHPCVLRIQPNELRLNARFLKMLVQDSEAVRSQLAYLSNATTIEVIYSNTMAEVVVVAPPLDEQEAIVSHVNEQMIEWDSLLHDAACAIALLQERRSNLISGAVTGQIDVRSFAGGSESA